MEPVRTHRAKTVVDAARLHRAKDRRERGLTLVEGPDLLSDVIAAGAEVVEVFATDHDGGHHVTLVDERALQRLAGTRTPRGPIAVVRVPDERLDRSTNLLVAVGVSDPGNIGTMIRTAASFGWGFAYTEGSADPWAPKAIRAGGAGQFQTPVARVTLPADMEGWTTVAAMVHDGEPPQAVVERPVAVLIGEEAHGLDGKMAADASHRLTIPTTGPTESLNAAIAAGIVVYELSRGSGQAPAGV